MAVAPRSKGVPYIKAIVSFEAAARHLSFTDAAEELCVTRVAVSRQTKALEDYLGCHLMIRRPRRLELTPEGVRLASAARQGLEVISEAIHELRNNRYQNSVNVATTIGVSTYWLMPRLNQFRTDNPDIDFRLAIASDPRGVTDNTIDLSICYGDQQLPGMQRQQLARGFVWPLCSRVYLEQHGPFSDPVELLDAHLLHFDEPLDARLNWKNWFSFQHAEYREEHARTGFSAYINLIQAMVDGHGIGLAGTPATNGFIKRGQLVHALESPPMELEGYYVYWRDGPPRSVLAQKFREWLLSQIESERSPHTPVL